MNIAITWYSLPILSHTIALTFDLAPHTLICTNDLSTIVLYLYVSSLPGRARRIPQIWTGVRSTVVSDGSSARGHILLDYVNRENTYVQNLDIVFLCDMHESAFDVLNIITRMPSYPF